MYSLLKHPRSSKALTMIVLTAQLDNDATSLPPNDDDDDDIDNA